jgi:serine/threonine protein kinase
MATWDYTKVKMIGSGTYGKVYEVTKDKKTYALKKIFNEDYDTDGFDDTTLREIDIILRANHPNIINCKAWHIKKDILYLIMDKADYDLNDWVNNMPDKHCVNTFKKYAFGILCGLKYLHDNKIIHGDIKPENMLIFDSTKSIQLADFGLLVHHYPGKKIPSTYNYSQWFRPIDLMMKNKRFDFSADMWAYGCLLYFMLTGKYLFAKNKDIKMVVRVISRLGSPSNKFFNRYPWFHKEIKRLLRTGKVSTFNKWKVRKGIAKMLSPIEFYYAFKLVEDCLKYLPEDRITVDKALKSPLFNSIYHTRIYPKEIKAIIPRNKKHLTLRKTLYELGNKIGKKISIRNESTLVLSMNLFDRLYIKRPNLENITLSYIVCLELAVKMNEEEIREPISEIHNVIKEMKDIPSYCYSSIIRREKTIILELKCRLSN